MLVVAFSCTPVLKGRQAEPSAIYIRNASGIHIDSIRISGEKRHGRLTPVGEISPLPAGVTQMVGRPSNPPKLPRQLTICWKPADRQICRDKDISGILKGGDRGNEALVFEIESRGSAGSGIQFHQGNRIEGIPKFK